MITARYNDNKIYTSNMNIIDINRDNYNLRNHLFGWKSLGMFVKVFLFL
jgi:hypothetical protein